MSQSTRVPAGRPSHPMRIAAALVLLLAARPAVAYQGFGASTPGGAGKSVYRLTNLNDSGSGSFCDAVSQGNRNVVFDVAGTISLRSAVSVGGCFLTIDGLSAPSPGITLKNAGLRAGRAFTTSSSAASASGIPASTIRF